MSIKLSICIPTYNRAAFLGEALDSVIRQATDEVEIVVSDNASTDNTEALVREYQARFPRIRYHKNPENLGADRNFLKVVELGEGEYCWLLGSDDALAEGAIAAMLPLLGDADVYLTDRTERCPSRWTKLWSPMNGFLVHRPAPLTIAATPSNCATISGMHCISAASLATYRRSSSAAAPGRHSRSSMS